MNFEIKMLFHINAPIQKVFHALSSIDGLSNWWTNDTSGSAVLDGIIKFRFAGSGGPDMKVIEQETNKKISWKCIDSPHGWVGHTFTFLLDENEEKTRIRFSHSGWEVQDDFYAICSFSWGRYMESLRQYCQYEKGEAFGSLGYRQ